MRLLTLFFACLLTQPGLAADVVKLANPGRPALVIQVAPDDALSARAAERLAGFVERACGKRPRIIHSATERKSAAKQAVALIGIASEFKPELNKLKLNGEVAAIKHDGYLLRTLKSRGQSYIIAMGQTSRGAVNGVWRLIREADVQDGSVTLRAIDASESPYIPQRGAMVTEPWSGECDAQGKLVPPPGPQREKYCQRNWPEARLHAYLDLLDSFGYNAIQLNDSWPMLSCLSQGTTRAAYAKRLRAEADYAHLNGQLVDLFLFGSSAVDTDVQDIKLVDTLKGDPLTGGACFTDPRERQVLLREYDWQAENYAKHVDRFMTHWTDPGGCRPGCQNCTIKTALEQHNILLRKFRAQNPSIQSAFSLWLLHLGTPWPAYKGAESVVNAGILDFSVALVGQMDWAHLRHDGRPIVAKGRQFGVWGWYFLDIECYGGLQVETSGIEKYFRSLPSQGGDAIQWHTVDAMSSYLILSNLYVAGQMMWNPQRSGAELLREFTRGMFGPENEGKMAAVYDTVEDVYPTLIPMSQYPWLTDLDKAPSRLARLEEAQKVLQSVRVAPDFVPAFPLVIQPADLLRETEAQLNVLHTYLEFQEAANRVLGMKRRGESREKLIQAVDALPKVPPPDEYLWQGVYKRYQGRLSDLRRALGI